MQGGRSVTIPRLTRRYDVGGPLLRLRSRCAAGGRMTGTDQQDTRRSGNAMASGGKTKRKRARAADGERGQERDAASQDSQPQAVAIHTPTDAEQERDDRNGVRRVGRREVAAHVSRIAAALRPRDATEVSLLEELAKDVAAGRRGGKGTDAVAAAVARCLDEAALGPDAAGRWALDEGVAWSLAWLLRSKRPGAAGLVERLAAEGGAAAGALSGGDLTAAPLLFTLLGLFSGFPGETQIGDAGRILATDLATMTSAEGAPRGGPAVDFIARVLVWTRAREAAESSGFGFPWDDATEARWKGSCVAALRLLGDRGRVPGRGGPEALDASPLLAILAAADSQPLCRAAAAVKGHRHAPPTGKTIPRDSASEGDSVAVLRTDWGRGAVRLLLDFSSQRHHLEIALGDRLVVSGEWGWSVEADGVPLLPTGPWTVCCFESDAKASFLEIVAPLPGGLQAERQIVLLPRDRVLVLTDSITDAGACLPASWRPDRIAYRSHLPLAEAGASRDAETRELRLRVGDRQTWRVLPLALPEWRAATAAGALDEDGDVLRLRGDGEGGRFSFPVWFDLDPDRADLPLTWRSLSVADQRQNLKRHEAVGFRVQVGLEQWLLYRALDTPRNRTLLGCNVACEFLLGRLRRSGEVSRTLEIE